METPDTRVVLVTVGDEESGLVLVRKVVEEKIVACGNLLPGVTSVLNGMEAYRKKGKSYLS